MPISLDLIVHEDQVYFVDFDFMLMRYQIHCIEDYFLKNFYLEMTYVEIAFPTVVFRQGCHLNFFKFKITSLSV